MSRVQVAAAASSPRATATLVFLLAGFFVPTLAYQIPRFVDMLERRQIHRQSTPPDPRLARLETLRFITEHPELKGLELEDADLVSVADVFRATLHEAHQKGRRLQYGLTAFGVVAGALIGHYWPG